MQTNEHRNEQFARYAASRNQSTLFGSVVQWCDRIQNGRGLDTATSSIEDEVVELRDEVNAIRDNIAPGSDGVFGEAIDVLVSTIDVIRMERPNVSLADLEREVTDYANKKCQKWAYKYGGQSTLNSGLEDTSRFGNYVVYYEEITKRHALIDLRIDKVVDTFPTREEAEAEAQRLTN